MCYFKLGQYHLAPLNSPQEEVYEYLFKGILSYLGLENPREPYWPICYGLVHQVHGLEDILGGTYIFRKLMISSLSW